MEIPAFYIPNFDELYEMTRRFVKEHQGPNGYIDTRSELGHDCAYAIVYKGDYIEEYTVFGIRWDDELCMLEIMLSPVPTSSSIIMLFSEKDFKSEDWEVLDKFSCNLHYSATLMSIAEVIHEYV